MESQKDPYGRFDMPEDKNKKYFSPTMPIRVLIYSYFWLLRQMFVEQWRSLKQEDAEQNKKPPYDRDGITTFFLAVGWVFLYLFVFGGIALVSHILVPIVFINGYLLFTLGVVFVLGTFFMFHLHTDEGFMYWKNKLL